MAVPIATEPTLQTQTFISTTITCDEINLNFTPGDGSRRLIIARPNAAVNAFPVDAVGYTSGSLFGTGSNLGNNNYVVYSGTGSTATITGLAGGTDYHFAIFEYNGNGTNSNYLLTGYLETDTIAAGFTMTISSTSGDMCRGDSVTIQVHGAETYSWSPSSTLSSSTDSVVIAKPTSTTNYTVTGQDGATGCSDIKNINIIVYQLPSVTLGNLTNRCINGGTLTLTSGSPSGGAYSGDGVSGNQFNPLAAGDGAHTITYTYSDIHSCTSSDQKSITVLSKPVVTFSTLSEVCVDATQFALSGGNPTGGAYSGTGVSSGQFNPTAAGAGQFPIRYVYTNVSGCSDTAFTDQKVNALPIVTFANLQPVCLNAQQFNLTGGSPSGGTYSGTGVSSNQFSPLVSGAGTFSLSYSYTNSNGCTSEDTSDIVVHTLPSVSFSALAAVCQNTGPVTLSGGSPSGGSYSGPGVGGGIFYSGIAGAGQHTITYTYSNSNNCTNSANQSLTVNPPPHPSLGPDVTVCMDNVAHLTAGTYSSYGWSTGQNSAAINLDTTGRGVGTFQIILAVTNNFGCANRDTILVTFDICTGISDIPNLSNQIIIFPNPSSGQFTVLSEEGSDISIYDLKGSLLFVKKNAPALFTTGENLPVGTYILKSASKNQSIRKLIIKN